MDRGFELLYSFDPAFQKCLGIDVQSVAWDRRNTWKLTQPRPIAFSFGLMCRRHTLSFDSGVFNVSEGKSQPSGPVFGELANHAAISSRKPSDNPTSRADFFVFGVSISPRYTR